MAKTNFQSAMGLLGLSQEDEKNAPGFAGRPLLDRFEMHQSARLHFGRDDGRRNTVAATIGRYTFRPLGSGLRLEVDDGQTAAAPSNTVTLVKPSRFAYSRISLS